MLIIRSCRLFRGANINVSMIQKFLLFKFHCIPNLRVKSLIESICFIAQLYVLVLVCRNLFGTQNSLSCSGDTAVIVGGEAGGGVVDPGGHLMPVSSSEVASTKPVSLIPALENIEEEQVHFSDQSASEESSLTDSER